AVVIFSRRGVVLTVSERMGERRMGYIFFFQAEDGIRDRTVTGVQTCALPISSLRAAVAHALPSYMLPSRWLAFDELPKTSNGKIDRRRLKELFAPEAVSAP